MERSVSLPRSDTIISFKNRSPSSSRRTRSRTFSCKLARKVELKRRYKNETLMQSADAKSSTLKQIGLERRKKLSVADCFEKYERHEES